MSYSPAESKVSTIGPAGDVENGKAWRKVRRPSDIVSCGSSCMFLESCSEENLTRICSMSIGPKSSSTSKRAQRARRRGTG